MLSGLIVMMDLANVQNSIQELFISYSFSDSLFSGGILEAVIGDSYTGGKNANLALNNTDYFGSSVSLDGNKLAIGAYLGDGLNNLRTNSGEVYIYSFSDNFDGLTPQRTIGHNYTGGKNINQQLDVNDNFGYSVSLDGNRLAVGSYADDGYSNWIFDVGSVYLYALDDLDNFNLFSTNPANNYTISVATLANLLSSQQNVSLLANNDIYFNSALNSR
ncbi:MAG: FG-GAP repeat protein [Sphingobacterium sp.]|nr:FG-GAP repeat protein [Sphingobacterium sp.]